MYYDGCNFCQCNMACIQEYCENSTINYCSSCESNLVWSDCAPSKPTTCDELISGIEIVQMASCEEKCTCPNDFPYWNGNECVKATQCYRETTVEAAAALNIITMDPTIRPTSNPTMTAPISARPTVNPTSRPSLSQPISARPTVNPSIVPTLSQPVSVRPTVNPTSRPTLSQPVSALPTKRPTYRPTKRPTYRGTPTKRPTTKPVVY